MLRVEHVREVGGGLPCLDALNSMCRLQDNSVYDETGSSMYIIANASQYRIAVVPDAPIRLVASEDQAFVPGRLATDIPERFLVQRRDGQYICGPMGSLIRRLTVGSSVQPITHD